MAFVRKPQYRSKACGTLTSCRYGALFLGHRSAMPQPKLVRVTVT